MDFHYVQIIENGVYRSIPIEEIETLFHVSMSDGQIYDFADWKEVAYNVINNDVRVISYDGKDGHDHRFVVYTKLVAKRVAASVQEYPLMCIPHEMHELGLAWGNAGLRWREEPMAAYDDVLKKYVWTSPYITTDELLDIIAREG